MEGDRQAPEGFYTVFPTQMNPNYYLAFNIGFPNTYERVNARSDRNLMLHGACSSAGCYSMTDRSIAQMLLARILFWMGSVNFRFMLFPFA